MSANEPSNVQLSRRAAWAEGQPISDLMARALSEPNLISLAAGFVDQQTLPAELTRQAFDAVFANPDAARVALQYGTTPGLPELRQMLLDRFLAENACCHDLTIDNVVITAGSNQLLHLVCESLLDPGDIVLCAAPTYLVFLGTLNNLGARSVGIAIDRFGMVPEALEARLQQLQQQGELERVKAIYLVPYADNPCGITMPLERRAKIVAIAKRWSRRHRIHVIADSAYRELHYQGEKVPSMLTVDEEGDTVVVAGTFSKSFAPGLRIGWGILPRHLVGPVCNQKGNIDFGSPNLNQHLMARILELGLFDSHLHTIRAGYQQKMLAMLAALENQFGRRSEVRWIEPKGGLYVWVELPDGIATGPGGRLFDLALQEGVLYVPGQYCYPSAGEPVRENTLRLSFGVQTPANIAAGIRALARAISHATACQV